MNLLAFARLMGLLLISCFNQIKLKIQQKKKKNQIKLKGLIDCMVLLVSTGQNGNLILL